MLGGLGSPRPPAEIVAGEDALRIITLEGRDVTGAFESGARVVGEQAGNVGARLAILKEDSPSCGTSFVYDGTFSGSRVAGEGVTATLLRGRDIAVFSENEIDAAAEYLASLERFSSSALPCNESANIFSA
jgi:uncharacterized protein YbbK (DUF523 family)